MHIMTKIFVALAAILSVALATLTMAYAVNADRIVQDLRSERAARQAAFASQEHHIAAFSALERDMSVEVERLKKDIETVRAQLREAQGALTQVEGQKAQAERAREAIRGEIGQLGSTVEMQAKLIDRLNDENSRLRENDIRLRREAIEFADKLHNIESQRTVLAQTVRQLELQIQELQLQLADASQAVPGLAGDTQAGRTGIIAVGHFTGVVSSVALDAGSNETLVRINLGSRDSIAPNMDLYVTRQNSWIANIRVIDVDLNHSVARVLTPAPGQTILPGDTVVSRLTR